MDRIKKLCGYLDKCVTFADVGCDHGYCTEYMLKAGLCKRAVVTDISGKCLEKAKSLLKNYIKSGVVTAVCCDGLQGVGADADEVLIAGMGGEEIVKILKNSFIPKSFVLQPMRNLRTVREYLSGCGVHISLDEPFVSDGKFYFVIKGANSGKCSIYRGLQLDFGLNLAGETTKKYINSELSKKRGYLKRSLSDGARESIKGEIRVLEEALSYDG